MRRPKAAFRDFRDFLASLRTQGELIEVDRAVAPKFEVAKALRKSAAVAGPAVVFKNNGTDFPLVGGVYNSRSKALIAFGCGEDNVVEHILDGLANRIPPVLSDTGPVHENIITGDAIDLSALPIPTYSPADGGPYITSGLVVSRDPESGIPDLGHYRFELIDNKTLSFLALPSHRFAKNLAKAIRLGQKTFRAALVIGVDPLLAYTGPIQVPDDTNDFEVTGGLRGSPVELVKCRTNDVEVPARAEFVIEFEVDFGTTVMEGPWASTPASTHPARRDPSRAPQRSPTATMPTFRRC
jgi:2,5-furandicarboxylate decarboxylase 1